jgi:hypothetical protein
MEDIEKKIDMLNVRLEKLTISINGTEIASEYRHELVEIVRAGSNENNNSKL